MDIFRILTPAVYYVLTVIWLTILVFCLRRFKRPKIGGDLFFTLIALLALEAFRSFFESAYFGVIRTAELGLIPTGVRAWLMDPGRLFVPKMLNLVSGVVVLYVLLKHFAPQEASFVADQNASRELIRSADALRASEERFRAVYEHGLFAMSVHDRSGTFIQCNPAYERLLGYTQEELTRLTFIDLTFEEDIPKSREKFRKLVEGQIDHYQIVKRYVRKDGSVIWCEAGASVIVDKDGGVDRVISAIAEINERKESEEKLHNLNETLQGIIDASPAAILTLDTDSRITLWSRAAEKIYGWKKEEVLGGPIPFIPEKEMAGYQKIRSHCLSGKSLQNIEVLRMKRDGNPIDISLSTAPLHDAAGNITGTVSISLDITDRKKAESAFRESEEKFRKAFENAAVGRVILRTDGTILQANNSITQTLGFSPREISQRKWPEFIHPESLDEARSLFQELIEKKKTSTTMVGKLLHKKGHSIWVRVFSILIRDTQDRPLYLVIDVEDITRQKEYEERLRKYEQIVSSSKDLMALINKTYTYEAVNDAFAEYHQKSREQIVGKTISELLGESVFREKVRHQFDRALSGQVVNYTLEFEFVGLGRRIMYVSYFPLRDSSGIVEGVVINSRDITETKMMEKRLVQSQKMEAIGALAGGIAHDFNNILSSIIGYAELLMGDLEAASDAHEHAKRIFTAGNRAGALVRQILTFSRSSDAEVKPLKIQTILKEVLNLVRSTIPANIEISQSIDNQCELVMADPTQIHQVAMNLITNAYHAMQDTGGKLDIRLENTVIRAEDLLDRSLSPGPFVCLIVEDSGHGMDPQTISQIFDPYFTTKARGKGTGLGLSVVHGIVKDAGGEIKVYSEVGKGSVFRVYFPAIADELKTTPSVEDSSIYRGSEHILVVDDEEALVDIQKSMLESMGYRVTTRTSSIEALNAFKGSSNSFDLVITDMTMPQMTGLQLTRELKKLRPNIKIITCTGFSEQLNEASAGRLEIDGFLMKPVIMAELSKLVRNVLDKSKTSEGRPGE